MNTIDTAAYQEFGGGLGIGPAIFRDLAVGPPGGGDLKKAYDPGWKDGRPRGKRCRSFLAANQRIGAWIIPIKIELVLQVRRALIIL
jgi:hypothetical protein